MNKNLQFSRRQFVKSATLGSTAIAGGNFLPSCGSRGDASFVRESKFPSFTSEKIAGTPGPAGLLYSQVGYEAGLPVRVIIRLPEKDLLGSDTVCKLRPVDNKKNYSANCVYWGALWGSHWWVAEFQGIVESGTWDVEIADNKDTVCVDYGLTIGKHILWDATIELSSVDMLERRAHFTNVGAGWQDAGALWVESCAQSAMIISLEDLAEFGSAHFEDDFLGRLHKQITVGCDYVIMTQEKVRELGYPIGAMSHDLHGHEHDILPADALKAVVALSRAARLLPTDFSDKKKRYAKGASLAMNWLQKNANPMGDYGMSLRQRGLPEDTPIPKDEWLTRDLIFFCWGALEQWKLTGEQGKDTCIEYARMIMARQIQKESAEHEYWGHFKEFDSLPHSENAWIHEIINNQFGADTGGLYPNYLLPLVEMLKLWPDHEDSQAWRNTLHEFAYSYLIPVCDQNPFNIVPLGIFGEEGPIWFAGPFHGSNTIYGYTAALALELADLFNDNKLKEIAYANLQWLAGLNAGITHENLKASVIYTADVPRGYALPASMIHGIGRRWAGGWFATRGVICNGFSTGQQFKMDTDPTKANDGPLSFTDEDWIPHSAGWLTALVRLNAII